MKNYLVYLIFLSLISFSRIAGDNIILLSGKVIQGEVLRVSGKNLIVEILSEDMKAATISIDLLSVKSVIDESKIVLFADGKLLVDDLDDYYHRFYHSSSRLDTVVFKSGKLVVCKITNIKGNTITYEIQDKSPKKIYIASIDQIKEVNNRKVGYKGSYTTFPTEYTYSYPHFSIEFGISTILQNLNDYQKLYKDLAIKNLNDQTYNTDSLKFRKIPKGIYAINLGLGIHITKNFILSAVGHFTLGFGDNQGHGEVTESYRLFLGELKYSLPFKLVSPWAAVGFSLQSITIINNYNQFNLKFQSSASTISTALGVQIKFNSQVGCALAFRYLPFGEKDAMVENTGYIENIQDRKLNSKIDLTNFILSASFFVNL